MPNLQTNWRLKLGFQTVSYKVQDGRLIHGTKHHMDNQL